MITSLILYIIFAFIWAITSPFRLFNDVSLPASFTEGVSGAVGYVSIIYQVLPLTLSAIVGVIVLYLVVEGSIALFKVVKWVYTKIPGIG